MRDDVLEVTLEDLPGHVGRDSTELSCTSGDGPAERHGGTERDMVAQGGTERHRVAHDSLCRLKVLTLDGVPSGCPGVPSAIQ